MQIKTPDEYDCMFTCQVRSQRVYHPHSPSKSYAGLRMLNAKVFEPSQLLFYSSDKECFLCPKAFKSYFLQNVKEAVQLRHTDATVGKSHT